VLEVTVENRFGDDEICSIAWSISSQKELLKATCERRPSAF
jgi:hypothetical protein